LAPPAETLAFSAGNQLAARHLARSGFPDIELAANVQNRPTAMAPMKANATVTRNTLRLLLIVIAAS
jgi:hypothetical protein